MKEICIRLGLSRVDFGLPAVCTRVLIRRCPSGSWNTRGRLGVYCRLAVHGGLEFLYDQACPFYAHPLANFYDQMGSGDSSTHLEPTTCRAKLWLADRSKQPSSRVITNDSTTPDVLWVGEHLEEMYHGKSGWDRLK